MFTRECQISPADVNLATLETEDGTGVTDRCIAKANPISNCNGDHFAFPMLRMSAVRFLDLS
jgi:hypothetical protein